VRSGGQSPTVRYRQSLHTVLGFPAFLHQRPYLAEKARIDMD